MPFFPRASSRQFKIRKQNSTPLMSAGLRDFIVQRMTDAGGLALAAAGLCLSLTLITFSAKDPSFNTVSSSAKIHNIFGSAGAYTADMLIQTIGLSSYFIAFAFLVWGGRILARRPVAAFGVRMPLLILAVLTGAVALARIPAAESWGGGTYLGGSAGALIFSAIANRLQSFVGPSAFTAVSLVSSAIFIPAYLFLLGISPRGWKEGMAAARHGLEKLHDEVSGLLSFFSRGDADEPAPLRRTLVRLSENSAPAEGETETPRRKPVIAAQKMKKQKDDSRQKKLDLKVSDEEWKLPALDILEDRVNTGTYRLDEASLQKNAELLQSTLHDFGVEGDILKVSPGPIVTLYEMEPAPGTKTSRVIGLSDDIARSMSAAAVRVAVVPGKNAIGIELPNAKRETVFLKEMLSSGDYEKTTAHLPLALGKNIAGDPVIADLARMPHLLVAGTTGSGKSVAINTMILSLLYRLSPEQCRFIMIDPKMLELSVYDDIPHLLTPVVTEAHRAVTSLKWAVREMEDRYRAMSKLGVRNIDGFNDRIRDARAKGEVLMHKVQTGFDSDTGKPVYEEQPLPQAEFPYIVIIVDEFADLMLVAGKEVENAVQRLAQMARAAGIHLIMATQRPSVDVITGVIKANFPTRISFQVTSKIDSRTILGEGGAEQLLGQGDMLYMAAGGRITRVHGPFVTDEEVEKIVKYLRSQGTPVYIDGVTEEEDEGAAGGGEESGGESDALYDQAVAIIIREGKVSTSFIQRHLQIGYNRAARIVDRMEREGLISAANHAGKREILTGNYGT